MLGGRGIPFARQNGPYAQASNQDMLIATLDAVAKSFELEGEVFGEVAAGAVLKHSRDFDLTREAVLGSRLAAETPAYDVQQACGTGLGATVGGGGIAGDALTLREVQIDRERLAAYHRLCGFAVTNHLAPTYPHMLAFPLHLALMTRGDFPFDAIGLIHTANHIVQHRRIDAGERLSLCVWSGPVEPHPRGRQFSIHTEARARDEVVWAETSTNLKRGDRSAQTARPIRPPPTRCPAARRGA